MEKLNFSMKRINVVGSSGSGKSTFSSRLSKKLNIPHYEMDSLFWKENWTMEDNDNFKEKVRQIAEKDRWILDGNYRRVNSIKWSYADTIIWIDRSFSRTLFQSLKRAIRRIVTKEEIWPGTGNRETFRMTFLKKDSILLWMITNYGRIRERYLEAFESKELEGKRVIRLSTSREIDNFLNSIKLPA